MRRTFKPECIHLAALILAVLTCCLLYDKLYAGNSSTGGETLQIFFERSGGFGGLYTTATIDGRDLPPDEVSLLQQLVEEAGFFDLPSKIISRTPQPDRFQYKLTVMEGGRQHTVTVSEEAIPPKLKPLINRLVAAAKQGRKDAVPR